MTTEDKILNSARKNFLLYGYYGTTIEKIAREAGVSKAIVHYYFRTKDNLYKEIIGMIADDFLHFTSFEFPDADLTWFIVSELRNNRTMLMKIIDDKLGASSITKIQKLLKRSMKVYSSIEFSKEN